MKTVVRHLPFTSQTNWAWPDGDEKLLQVFDDVLDIDIIMQYVDKRQVCVQAGGACGVWPLRYSQLFDWVYTFEPMFENIQCLLKNTEGIENILPYRRALAHKEMDGAMVFDQSEIGNYGAVYFQPGEGDALAITIDEFDLDACDLLQLDIEGYELEALKGAVKTIEKYHPVIVLEEKPLPQFPDRDHLAPRRFIEAMGYKEVDRVKKDVIFKV